MDNFIAIDVETANNQPSSICAIGAVKVVDGVIADRFYQLVKPEPEWYIRHFSEEIHGIFPEDTRDAPTFDRVWMSMLEHFGIAVNWDKQKSRRTIPRQLVGSYSLPYVCEFMGIPFYNHHNALADAEACAKIAMTLL